MILGVALTESTLGQIIYGPFPAEHRDVAVAFAGFLTDEVDPARVVEFPDGTDVAWTSPVVELLHWRAVEQQRASQIGTCEELVTFMAMRQHHEFECTTAQMKIPAARAAHYEQIARQLLALGN